MGLIVLGVLSFLIYIFIVTIAKCKEKLKKLEWEERYKRHEEDIIKKQKERDEERKRAQEYKIARQKELELLHQSKQESKQPEVKIIMKQELKQTEVTLTTKQEPKQTEVKTATKQAPKKSEAKRKMYIFFDTETTGLPRDFNAPTFYSDNWPRLVQLSWILEDETRKKLSEGDVIIYPSDFVIPYEASRIHGITQDRAKREGIPLKLAIERFMKDFNKADMIVGHNISFDKKIVGAELIRLGMWDTMETNPSYCTMMHGMNICRLPGKYGGYKWPKLQELHRTLFGYDFQDAHNSASDIAATERCYWRLRGLERF